MARSARGIAAVLGMVALCAAPVARAEELGAVAELEGQAEVLRAGASEWTPLAAGDAVQLGDKVRTATGSKMKLLVRDDTVLVLAPGTTLELDDQTLGTTAPTSRFSLLLGTLRALVTDRYHAPGARFEVETPTAVCGVRGTGFITAYDAAREETVVLGLSDTTAVRAKLDPGGQREVRVGPGQMTKVGRGSYPLRPSPTPEGTLRSFTGSTEVRGAKPAAPGKGAAGQGAGDPRLPKRAGQGALSPEGQVDQVVDQPPQEKRRGPTPPPPPVPSPRH